MKEPIEFSHREQFLLSYYRDRDRARSRRFAHDGSYLVISLACLAWYYFKQDVAFGFVGYAILFWRVASGMFKSQQYGEDFRSIFEKYDAKVKELSERLESNR